MALGSHSDTLKAAWYSTVPDGIGPPNDIAWK